MRRHAGLPVFTLILTLAATGLVATAQEPAPRPAEATAEAPMPEASPTPPAPDATPQPQGPERFDCTLVNQGAGPANLFQAGYCTIQVEEYTSGEDTLALALALKDGGQMGLLKKLWKMKQIGFIKLSGTMGYPIFAARSRPTGDGRIVRLLTNRPMVPREFGGRSGDYPFGYIELFLPSEGKGHGTLIPMAQLGFSGSNTLVVESYGTIPYRIVDVESVEAKAKKK